MAMVSIPDRVNGYRVIRDVSTGLDGFLCRLKFTDDLPPGAIRLSSDECVVAFGRRCTHMGCRLLTDPVGGVTEQMPTTDGVLRCPCHASCFDLLQAGLVVIGPATDWLPMLELTAVHDTGSGAVVAVDVGNWRMLRSVPFGVPYAGTSARPNNP
jgi:Rieske Fe-S protein